MMATALISIRAAPFPLRAAAVAPSRVAFAPAAGKQQKQVMVQLRAIRLRAQATYKVKLITPEGEFDLEVPDDVYILDHAEDQGIELPYSCRAGSCGSCADKLVSGEVDQSYQRFLDNDHQDAGWVLLCHTYPMSDHLVIQTHMEEKLAFE